MIACGVRWAFQMRLALKYTDGKAWRVAPMQKLSIFTQKNQLLAHIKNVHEIKCFFDECIYTTETENQIIIHLDEEHLVAASNDRLDNRPSSKKKECRYYKQGKCTKGIVCKFDQKESPVKCETCRLTIKSSQDLNIHIKNKHSEEKPTPSSKACRNGNSCPKQK